MNLSKCVGSVVLRTWKVPSSYPGNTGTYNFTHANALQSALHEKTWADAGPFKVKYLVNAEKFILNFQSDPFKNKLFFVSGQCLKRELSNNI